MPKAVGILSRWPFIDLFRDYLSSMVFKTTTGLNLPLERYLINLAEEIPLPPRGKVEVEITLDRLKFFCARPPVNKVPIIKNVGVFFFLGPALLIFFLLRFSGLIFLFLPWCSFPFSPSSGHSRWRTSCK